MATLHNSAGLQPDSGGNHRYAIGTSIKDRRRKGLLGRSAYGLFVATFATVLGGDPSLADNAYIANVNDGTVSVIDTSTNTVTTTIPGFNRPSGVAATLDGRKVYVVNQAGDSVSVIDTANNSVTATVPVTGPFEVAVSPNGSRLYVGYSHHSSIYVIDTSSNTITGSIPLTSVNDYYASAPYGIVVSPDGARLYVVINTGTDYPPSYDLEVIDTQTNDVIQIIPVGAWPFGVAVSPNGDRVYVANVNGNSVSVIDTTSYNVTTINNIGFQPYGLVVTPDNTKVYVSNNGGGSNKVSVIDVPSGEVVKTIPVSPCPYGIDVTADGSKIFTGGTCSGGVVSVIDTATDMATGTVTAGNAPYSFGRFISHSPNVAKVQQPINADASSVFKASRGVIPVIFALYVSGVPTCALPNATIALTRTSGGTVGSVDESTYEMAADNGANYRVSDCQYIYNLGSKNLGTGTYRVDILVNGSVVGNGIFGMK
jgi:YVTN family beta-propeller protein